MRYVPLPARRRAWGRPLHLGAWRASCAGRRPGDVPGHHPRGHRLWRGHRAEASRGNGAARLAASMMIHTSTPGPLAYLAIRRSLSQSMPQGSTLAKRTDSVWCSTPGILLRIAQVRTCRAAAADAFQLYQQGTSQLYAPRRSQEDVTDLLERYPELVDTLRKLSSARASRCDAHWAHLFSFLGLGRTACSRQNPVAARMMHQWLHALLASRFSAVRTMILAAQESGAGQCGQREAVCSAHSE